MSYNGSGTFQINTSGQPVVTGTVISSSAFNALTADLATGLSTAITKDGQTATTVRIPFAQGINSSLATDTTSGSTGSIYTAGGVGITKGLFVGGTATFSATPVFSALTASSAVATDASKNLVSVTNTGTGSNVLATSPTLVTPALGTPSALVGTNITGTATSFNINGTVGATTPAAGSFTSVTNSGLTTGRVVYTTTGGLETSSANLAYNGTTLTLVSDTTVPTLSVLGNSATPNLRLGSQGNTSQYWNIGRDNLTTGDFIFANQTSEKMRIAAGGNLLVGVTSANANGGILQLSSGITFPATAVAATDANTLDDYEEGTFTPTVAAGTTTTGSVTATGTYTKVGRIVSVSGYIGATTVSYNPAGGGFISGLPFAVISNTIGTAVMKNGNNSGSSVASVEAGSAILGYASIANGAGTIFYSGTFMTS